MSFHEEQFPPKISFGALGGPYRRTEIVSLHSGFEERNTPWAHSRRRWDAGVGMRTLDELEAITGFFEARQGQMYGFRWKDWADYRSATASFPIEFDDQVIGIGDGVQDRWQLVKTYRSGEQSYVRPIVKPVGASVRVGIGGVELQEDVAWSVDLTTGLISFVHPPDEFMEITAGFEFDVPVRFDTDEILTSVEHFGAGQAPSVPVVEVRV